MPDFWWFLLFLNGLDAGAWIGGNKIPYPLLNSIVTIVLSVVLFLSWLLILGYRYGQKHPANVRHV
jgi:hypothetical protein